MTASFTPIIAALGQKYQKQYARLGKAIANGRFAQFTARKKQQVLVRLARYERQLARYGVAVASAATLLLGAASVQAQASFPIGPEVRANTYTTNSQRNAATAMDSDGNYVIVWGGTGIGDFSGIFGQRYDKTGVPQGIDFLVNTYTTSTQGNPSIAMDSDGDFVVAWESFNQDGSSYGVYAQRYNNMGTAQGTEFQVNTYTTSYQNFLSIAMDSDGDFVVAWQSNGQDGSSYGVYARRYDKTGSTQGVEFLVNAYTTSVQSFSSIAMDSDGDFVVSWQSNGQDGSAYGVYARRYNNMGTAQGGEFPVNTYTTGNQFNPSIAMDSDGDFVVAWSSSGQDGSNSGVYARRYNATGTAQGSEFLVNTYTTGNQLNPNIAIDSDGDFVVSWQSYLQDGNSYGVYAQRYNATGSTQGVEFRVNTYTTSQQSSPSIAMDSDGDFVVAWQSRNQEVASGNFDGIYAQRYSINKVSLAATANSGTEVGATAVTLTATTSQAVVNDQTLTVNVTGVGITAADYALSSSTITILNGQTQGTVTFTVVNDALSELSETAVLTLSSPSAGIALGSTVSQQIQIIDNDFVQDLPFGNETLVNTFTANNQQYPAVAKDNDGDYVVVWQSTGQPGGDGFDIYAQRYNAAGTAQGSEFRVNTETSSVQAVPSIAMDSNGDFVVAWISNGQDGDNYGIYARQYNGNGTAKDIVEFLVNTETSNQQRAPRVAMDSDGDFVVVWQSDEQDGNLDDIYAQRYNKAGIAQGNEFQVNSYTNSFQRFPQVAMDSDGDFVVVWASDGPDGNLYGISAQRYNAAGTAQGSEFTVNTETNSLQFLPSVAMDSDGDFVVTWQSYGQEGLGSNYGIYAQRYNAAGTAQGSEFLVNTETSNYQGISSVAMDNDGDFVVAWQSKEQDGSDHGIYAQRYTATGASVGSEFLVNTETSSMQNYPYVAMSNNGDFVVVWSGNGQNGDGYGIHAQQYTVMPIFSEIAVLGNATLIADGSTAVTAGDHTLIASQTSGTVFTRTFSVQNLAGATGPLTVSALSTDNAFFSIGTILLNSVAQTLPFQIPVGNAATVEVHYTAVGAGTRFTTVTLTSDDADEATYTFRVQGSSTAGTCN